MAKNNLPVLLIILSVIYFILYLILDDTMLYIIIQLLGTLLSFFIRQVNEALLILLWVTLLVGSTYEYNRIKKKPVKYFFLSLIVVLMYIVDYILYNLLNIKIINTQVRYLNVGIIVIVKSLILSLIIYFERKRT